MSNYFKMLSIAFEMKRSVKIDNIPQVIQEFAVGLLI